MKRSSVSYVLNGSTAPCWTRVDICVYALNAPRKSKTQINPVQLVVRKCKKYF